MLLIFFFFSSRRRHTRSTRDWSSDVCSSDLDGRKADACPGNPGRPLIPASASSDELPAEAPRADPLAARRTDGPLGPRGAGPMAPGGAASGRDTGVAGWPSPVPGATRWRSGMERSDHPRVVVVGGGIIGSAIAMHLAERGLRPLLVDVDEDRAGEAASARSFASLSAFGNDPVAYYELGCAALASWPQWAERLGEVGYRRGGELRWAADPQQGRELAEQVERARSRG